MSEAPAPPGIDRDSRLRQMSWWNAEVVRSATAIVAGVGALGNEVLKNLLLLGWGRIVLVDFDFVELSNLSRSVLFQARDLGKKKIHAAMETARGINPDCAVEGLCGDLRLALGAGMVSRSNLVFGCLDNLEARLALSNLSGAVGVPMIDGGLSEWEGTVSLYHPPAGPCFGCGLDRDDLASIRLRRSCAVYAERAATAGGVPTTPVVASITAGLMVQQGLKYIHGIAAARQLPFGHQIRIDTAFNRFWCYQLPRNVACPFHPERQQAETLSGVDDATPWHAILKLVRDRFESPDAVMHLPQAILEKWRCPACGRWDTPVRFHVPGDIVKCKGCDAATETTLFNQITGTEAWLDATPAQAGLAPLSWIAVVHSAGVSNIEISRATPQPC